MHHAILLERKEDRAVCLFPLFGILKMLYPERGDRRGKPSILLFNDHPDTTLEDVLRVLKLADV